MTEREPIGVVGAGWVGLVTAACFAELGHRVVARDIVAEKVESLRRGEVPIHEPGLSELIVKNRERLSFTLEMGEVLDAARLVFVCVETPPTYSGDADLSAVMTAVEEIGDGDGDGRAIVMKSTVPVGTGRSIARQVPGLAYVSCPEFLREGTAVKDFLEPDRVVVGGSEEDSWAADAVEAVYAPLGAPIVRTDVSSAEMIKLASNAFLATKISFINEIANVSEEVGADVTEVARGMGMDDRIGPKFLNAGLGFGGSCLVGEERVLVRRHRRTSLRRLDELFDTVAAEAGADPATTPLIETPGLEVASTDPGTGETRFYEVEWLTRRDYDGAVVDVRTKMGRRVRCTADHPWVVSAADGSDRRVVEASDLSTTDWLPLASGAGAVPTGERALESVAPVSGADAVGAGGGDVIVRPREEVIAAHSQRLPDRIWDQPVAHKRALLAGMWLGDGSRSWVSGGPGLVLEYETASPELADGLLRLLGDVGIVASMRVGRTAKSTVDTYWVRVSGADQVESALFLVPEDERDAVRSSLGGQAKRIAPAGFRRVTDGTLVRVTALERSRHTGPVYSMHVPGPHTFAASGGLVTHNCFPKDTHALKMLAGNIGYHFQLLSSVIEVNELQKRRVTAKLSKHLGSLGGRRVALLGLAFKPGTDDMREASSLVLSARLQGEGATVVAYDPVATGRASELLPKVEMAGSALEALEGADAAVLVTEWPEFRELDWVAAAGRMATPLLVDGRNFLDPGAISAAGLDYEGIGRPGVAAESRERSA